jgi:predicted 3-demethylubiquinone-9 3-methyltransferase (glyoxalase superfamily)
MQKISTFLWFDDQAEEAARHYVSVFSERPGATPDSSRVLDVRRYGAAGPGTAGSVMTVSFRLEGQELIALNGGPEFHFTEAISLRVQCASQDEVDWLWSRLADGGERGRCGWLKDRYGLSWQVNPILLDKLLGDPDPTKSQAVMAAMLKMDKIDSEEIQRAYDTA